MARRVSWTNNSSGHDGSNIYKGENTDSISGIPHASIGAVALGQTAEWVDQDESSACYMIRDYFGEEVGPPSEVICASAPAPEIGSYWEGGVYMGVLNIGGTDYHIILGLQSSQASLRWKTSNTFTSGATSNLDGLANTLAMEQAGLSSHPAAQHCVNYSSDGYSDWYLPALNEIAMTSNISEHPEVPGDPIWWASTNASDLPSAAPTYRYANGDRFWYSKGSTYPVRPVRRVPA